MDWTWNDQLKDDERFAPRLWRVGHPEEKHSLTWTTDMSYQLYVDNDQFPAGKYYVNLAVVRPLGGNEWESIVETDPIEIEIPNNVTFPTPPSP